MCCCGKPTINGEAGYSWDGKTFGIRPVDPPTVAEGEEIIFDEPGRCGGVDSHCHHFRLIRRKFGGLALLARSGLGDSRIEHLTNDKAFGYALNMLDSNKRYWVFCAIYHAVFDAQLKSRDKEAERWRLAAAEGRIKTRKQRGKETVKVWIEGASKK